MARKIRFRIADSDDFWTVIGKFLVELKKQNRRKRFRKMTKLATLFEQNCRCKFCFTYLDFPDFDHIDGNRSNNSYENCQALCPNCHARKTRKKF